MTDKLLPCPFCGGEARIAGKDGYYAHVICLKCFATSASRASRGTVELNEKVIAAWNTRKAESTHEFVDRLIRHQRLLKAKHWARSGWDGVPPEEVEEYKATYAAFTKVISYIQAWDERTNK